MAGYRAIPSPRRTLVRICLAVCGPLAILLVAGCGGVAQQPPAVRTPGTGAPTTGVPSGPIPTQPSDRLTIAATDGTIQTPFDVTVRAGSDDTKIVMNLAHNVGTVNYHGRVLQAVALFEQPFPAIGQTIYETLAVDAHGIYVFWAYCQGDAVTALVSVAPDGAGLRTVGAAGGCTHGTSGVQTRVRFPAVDAPKAPLVGNFHINGSALQLDGASPGRIVFGGAFAKLLVFAQIDCTRVCGADGWYELHALIVESTGRVTLGILYLHPSDPSHVTLAWCISLGPDPQLLESAGNFDARWSGSMPSA